MNWELTIGGGFIVGAIFWAGATYNRVSAIEGSLRKIEAQLPALGRVAVLEERQAALVDRVHGLERRIEARA